MGLTVTRCDIPPGRITPISDRLSGTLLERQT